MGLQQPEGNGQGMFCANCGSKLPSAARYCMHCGTPTFEAEAPPDHSPPDAPQGSPEVSATVAGGAAAPERWGATGCATARRRPDGSAIIQSAHTACCNPETIPRPLVTLLPPRHRRLLIAGGIVGAVLIAAVIAGALDQGSSAGTSGPPALDPALAVAGFTRGYAYPGHVTTATTPLALSWRTVSGACHYQIETTTSGTSTDTRAAADSQSMIVPMRYSTPYVFRIRAVGCNHTVGRWRHCRLLKQHS